MAPKYDSDLDLRNLNQIDNNVSKIERITSDMELFSYILSHDLKKPLRVLMNNSKELQEINKSISNNVIDELSNEIIDASLEMQDIVHILLEYIRLEVHFTNFKKIDCNEILEITLNELADLIEKNNAIIEYDVLPKVLGHKKQLIIVFKNLIENAIKFRREDEAPKIKISCKEHNGIVEFTVSDNGIGIEEEYFEMIFLLFQRLHTIEEYPGRGGGLAICKKIVENHGGKISVKSVINKGSSFIFTLCKA
ncbi:MAG: sensor histidine kinase [Alphaproteobacteria bacterium]